MRLDIYLTEKGFSQSRTEAKNFIVGGAVSLNGRVITKPSFDIAEDADGIAVDKSTKKYVSRGGYKLEGALRAFSVSVSGRLALDVGASSGGFTDCLLQNGAEHVISVDSGRDQMAESIRSNSRVTVIENYNARYMKSEDFHYVPNLAVMDVSFISATYIMPSLYSVLSVGADFICLIKPQFEVGRALLGKGGIVKDKSSRMNAVQKVTDFAMELGFKLVSVIESPIQGGDGNIEYLAHLRKE